MSGMTIEEAIVVIWNRCQHCKETEEAIKALKEQRPHGEWILDAKSPCSIAWFRCSYCGYKYEAYKHSNFCPNCGANMRKDEAE